MNLNDFAKKITLKEGKKINLSIAQVKEVLHIVIAEMGKLEPNDLIKMMDRIWSPRKRK